MQDLFACRLAVQGEGAKAFDELRNAVMEDVAEGFGAKALDAPDGSLALEGGGTVRWRLLVAPDRTLRLWTLWWDRPYSGRSDLTWMLTAKVTLEAGRAAVILHVGVRPVGSRLLPLRFDVEALPLARTVVDRFNVVEDGWPLCGEPAYAEDRGGAAALAELLLDPDRVLPVVVISPVSSTRGPLVDPEAVAATLVGLAHVTVIDTPAITYDLTELVGQQLSVFGGSVRLWWPGLSRDSDPRAHHLWLPARLADPRNQPFERMLLRLLVTAASFRFGTAPLEARILAALASARRAEVDRLWARASEASLAPEWQDELERAWADNERLRVERDDLMTQLATAQENLAAIAAYRVPGNGEGGPPRAEGHDPGDVPTSVAQAVAWAADECEHLVFLKEAIEAAERAAYRHPGRVWRALLAMDEIASAWSRKELGSSFFDAFAERGFDFRSQVSMIATGRWGHEYERTYEGRVVTMGPHLALGRGSPEACCRIYWSLDEDEKVFVVGHVGRHLSDTTTG